jgi:VanZ family protein
MASKALASLERRHYRWSSVSALARLSLWLPPIALMAVIFFFSAQPDLTTGLGLVEDVGRKLVHAGEYALLCVLWWRALRTVSSERVALPAAVLISVAYAVTDEVHQTFVPTRWGSPVDVAIDALGAALAALVIHRRTERRAQPAADGLSQTG